MSLESERVIDWYDNTRRHFPWRAEPGKIPNPYHVWLSEIMLQQTTTSTVISYFTFFIKKWPTVESLAKATLDEILHSWQGLGYYARARNLHKCAEFIVKDFQGHFPQSESDLLKLPGIGPYTAAAITAIAYDTQTSPVDGNIMRIMTRLYELKTPIPAGVPQVKSYLSRLVPDRRNGDFVQALMDIGATICTPNEPECKICPLKPSCLAFRTNSQHLFPVRPIKPPRPIRHAVIFWIEDTMGRILMQKRPEKGLLGGMMEFPSTPWVDQQWALNHIDDYKPIAFKAQEVEGHTEHTFTHFHLVMKILRGKYDGNDKEGLWVAQDQFKDYALPTVMKKVVKHVIKFT